MTSTGYDFDDYEFLLPESKLMDLENIWFQQVTVHTAKVCLDFFPDQFSGRLFSQRDDLNWPVYPSDVPLS